MTGRLGEAQLRVVPRRSLELVRLSAKCCLLLVEVAPGALALGHLQPALWAEDTPAAGEVRRRSLWGFQEDAVVFPRKVSSG